ncbi:hypothetical protein PFICI_06608 [Pestalotiopsis fici W106-1]|uniref:Transcription factor domain-containing protein n=1 Tax=Pestalotiopsis fici (strain W106-1 / CGMCC3.15140) TaxID=1229662 RepID=W3X8U9_PESFW|nr:uncharacterized protein PFICI_06608 [Pestalotiopsis fici W106-1]ETS81606.1 hypothetical protein PFICI_06608 [Pestalotiopsis fici W106-1]
MLRTALLEWEAPHLRFRVLWDQIFLKLFSRFKTSIDGNPDLDSPYHKLYMPFCIQNPLLVQISIYTVACFLTETRHLDKQQSILIKGQTIRMLNDRLRSTEDAISDASIAGVCQMIADEWYWGDMHELLAHLKGMRHMIELRGGYQNLGLEGLLSKMIIVTDFGIAITFELPPYLQEGKEFQFEDRTPGEHRVSHHSPLVASALSFANSVHLSGLHPTTASILDDIRFLIALAISTPAVPSTQQAQKLKWTADWIHGRIQALPNDAPPSEPSATSSTSSTPQAKEKQNQSTASSARTSHEPQRSDSVASPDYLYQSIRQAALLYTTTIAATKPFSQTCSPDDFCQLWVAVWRVPLGVWKSLLGIFLWIEVAVLAAARDTPHGRFVKSMYNIAALSLATEDWDAAIAALRSALNLQSRLTTWDTNKLTP